MLNTKINYPLYSFNKGNKSAHPLETSALLFPEGALTIVMVINWRGKGPGHCSKRNCSLFAIMRALFFTLFLRYYRIFDVTNNASSYYRTKKRGGKGRQIGFIRETIIGSKQNTFKVSLNNTANCDKVMSTKKVINSLIKITIKDH